MKLPASRIFLVIVIVLVLIGSFLVKRTGVRNSDDNGDFHRNGVVLNYTRHAQCRMACRDIDTADIRQILEQGTINWSQSHMNDKPCPSYALEGQCRHGDELRVVFAQCESVTKVVTCFPLNRHPDCHCPGDKN